MILSTLSICSLNFDVTFEWHHILYYTAMLATVIPVSGIGRQVVFTGSGIILPSNYVSELQIILNKAKVRYFCDFLPFMEIASSDE